ncbi:MAG: hypothetical protein AAF927_31545 [Bacteroidota bacterium]
MKAIVMMSPDYSTGPKQLKISVPRSGKENKPQTELGDKFSRFL